VGDESAGTWQQQKEQYSGLPRGLVQVYWYRGTTTDRVMALVLVLVLVVVLVLVQ
jgi:hypothetical protein